MTGIANISVLYQEFIHRSLDRGSCGKLGWPRSARTACSGPCGRQKASQIFRARVLYCGRDSIPEMGSHPKRWTLEKLRGGPSTQVRHCRTRAVKWGKMSRKLWIKVIK